MNNTVFLSILLLFASPFLRSQENPSLYRLSCPSEYYNQCETEKCKSCSQDSECRARYQRDFGEQYNDCDAMSAMQSVEVEIAINRCKEYPSMTSFSCYQEFMALTTKEVEQNFNESFPASVDAQHAQAVEELTAQCSQSHSDSLDMFNCMRQKMSERDIPTWTFMNEVYLKQHQINNARMLAFAELGCSQNPDSSECQCITSTPSACSPAVDTQDFYQNISNASKRFGASATENRESAFAGLCRPTAGKDPSLDDFATAIRRVGSSGFPSCRLTSTDGPCPNGQSTDALVDFVRQECFANRGQAHSYCEQIQHNLTRRYCRSYCEDAKKGMRFEGSSRALGDFEECGGILTPAPAQAPVDVRSIGYQCRERKLAANERQETCLKLAGVDTIADALDEDLMSSLMDVNVGGMLELIRAQTLSDQVKRYNEEFGEEVDLTKIPGCSEMADSVVTANESSDTLRERNLKDWSKVNELLGEVSRMQAAAEHIDMYKGCFEPSMFSSCPDECIENDENLCPSYAQKNEEYLSARRVIVMGLLENKELMTGVDEFDDDLYMDFLKLSSSDDTGYRKFLAQTPQYKKGQALSEANLEFRRNSKRLGDLRAGMIRSEKVREIEENFRQEMSVLNTRGCDSRADHPLRSVCDNLYRKTHQELIPEAKKEFLSSIERTCQPEENGGISYKELAYMRPQAHQLLSEIYENDPHLADFARCENLQNDRKGFYRQYCCMYNSALETDRLVSDFYGKLNLTCSITSVGAIAIPPVGAATNLVCLGLKTSTVGMSSQDALAQENVMRSQGLAGNVEQEAFLRSYESRKANSNLASEVTTDAAFAGFGAVVGAAGAFQKTGRVVNESVAAGASVSSRAPASARTIKNGVDVIDNGRNTVNTVNGIDEGMREESD